MIVETSPSKMQAYQLSLGSQIRRVNESDALDMASATTEDQDTRVASHYQVPNLSSMLYEFTNREHDRI
jgi:hypothetical protein